MEKPARKGKAFARCVTTYLTASMLQFSERERERSTSDFELEFH